MSSNVNKTFNFFNIILENKKQLLFMLFKPISYNCIMYNTHLTLQKVNIDVMAHFKKNRLS